MWSKHPELANKRTFTGGTGCVGYSYTSSGWFDRIEPLRTFSNISIAELTRRVESFQMSLGRFDYTEPSLTTPSQGEEGV